MYTIKVVIDENIISTRVFGFEEKRGKREIEKRRGGVGAE